MFKKHKKKIVIILAVVLGLVSIAGALVWFNPLMGAPLPEQTSSFDPGLLEKPPQDVTVIDPVEPTPDVPAPIIANTEAPPQPLCDRIDSLAFLVLGIDENAQADAIRLVRVDFLEGKVSVLSIPRDFHVPIVDMSEYGITQGRINATYGYGEYYNGRGKGIFSVANNIDYNFGVAIDHYIVLEFKNIARYIDLVDGVEIHLEQPVADGRLYFSSGDHLMDGETAVGFMRMRYYDTDFARIRRQTMVIKAFYRKVLDELNPIQQTQLALSGLQDRNIQTDLAVKDLMPLLCISRLVQGKDVNFIEIPSEMYYPYTTPSGGNVQVPYDTVVPFIQSVMDGSYTP